MTEIVKWHSEMLLLWKLLILKYKSVSCVPHSTRGSIRLSSLMAELNLRDLAAEVIPKTLTPVWLESRHPGKSQMVLMPPKALDFYFALLYFHETFWDLEEGRGTHFWRQRKEILEILFEESISYLLKFSRKNFLKNLTYASKKIAEDNSKNRIFPSLYYNRENDNCIKG